MKIYVYNSQATQLYLASGTADGTHWMPRALATGQQGYRELDVPADTTWSVYTWPALGSVGTFSPANLSTIVINADNTISSFSHPSALVGSAWQSALPFTIPVWVRSEDALSFLGGLFLASTIMITRACLRWFKRAGTERHD